ncbi:sugar transferase [Oscillibacter sp.]|jgi:undecaprenyl phosphate N,N'-diacetylbacillosamine 1-phosphate transferase|uniref:sugar transferase n=1 Tax=Oscillibacter sp. TaxID=1945593 RepID=UPI00216E45BB|nr:sugar transferase [Oscillibacter sp.]MCI9648377.1 sugar transferase [Oscillibacter sp.]
MGQKLQLAVKRLADIVISLLVLVILSPLWLLTALLIRWTSPGPALFVQERPGKDRVLFKVYKFRSMRLGSEKMVKGVEVMRDDDRVTPIGRFIRRTKIDEIPQCLNVLRGEMSLIGPRPERVASLADYDEEISKRLKMRPGMTGLAQVSGNIYISLEDRYRLDVYYVENFSLWLDIRILLRTVGVVLLGEERYKERPLVEHVFTAPEEQAGRKEEMAVQ